MKFKKNITALLFSIGVSVSGFATADQFPAQPIRIIVPSSPGGILDLTSRLIGEKLSKLLNGHSVVIQNMPGGGGIIGMQGLLRSDPDGHTLVMGSLGPNAANYTLYPNLPYKASDFTPVMNVISMPSVLVVHPSVPANNLDAFKAYAKAQNGRVSMAISTTGASGHLIGEMMKHQMGIETINVVYKGAAPAMNDLIGGQVNFTVDNMITSLQMIQAGRVKALAVFTDERSELLPGLATVKEQGYPQLVGGTWVGLLVSAKTPAARVLKLNELLNTVLNEPETRKALIQQGGEPIGGSSQKFETFIASETEKWEKVIKAAGIKVD
jgi:tripartite-type tricarboxylate transporter receptor subunit TctC